MITWLMLLLLLLHLVEISKDSTDEIRAIIRHSLVKSARSKVFLSLPKLHSMFAQARRGVQRVARNVSVAVVVAVACVQPSVMGKGFVGRLRYLRVR